jgi:hypothetical protein
MATTLSTAARNAACNAIVDLVDGGTTDSAGDIVLMGSGDVEVATCLMSNPAFGAAATGVATAAAIASDTNATGGTIFAFKVVDRDNAELWRGSVGTTGSGADLEMSTTLIGAGDTVAITSYTFTVPDVES